ncbi:MAG: InlB B-repeat-containing protein [Spirochaetaceae bacterium]|nr:InlB B-repeat-containing protein [Spirochaetaceae bacterium]
MKESFWKGGAWIPFFAVFVFAITLTACQQSSADDSPRNKAPDKYTVTFDANGGSWEDASPEEITQSVAPGAFARMPSTNPALSGCAFLGWVFNKLNAPLEAGAVSPEQPWSQDIPVRKNITLYAVWQVIPPESRVVNFIPYEGAARITRYALESNGFKLRQAEIPSPGSREGYTLLNGGKWYLDNGTEFTINTVALNDMVVSARWDIKTYTVRFFTNIEEQTTAYAEFTVNHFDKITLAEIPEKENFVFQGWYTEQIEDILISDMGSESTPPAYNKDIPAEGEFSLGAAEVTSDLNLYALWQELPPNAKVITFLRYEGSFAGRRFALSFYDYKLRQIEFPAIGEREHYTLASQSWFDDASAGSAVNTSTVFNADTTLYAHWTGKTYTVDFKKNDGLGGVIETKTVTYPVNTVSTPSSAGITRTHYTTDGKWYTQAIGGGEFTQTTVITGNTSVYLHWAGNTYTVSFDKNDGSSVIVDAKSVTYPANTVTPPNIQLTRPNYTFDGEWLTESNAPFTNTTPVTKDIIVYAKWNGVVSTVSFDVNGAAGAAPSPVAVVYPATQAVLPAANPTRAGWTFQGWFETRVADITIVSSNPSIVFSAEVPAVGRFTAETQVLGDKTVYALWKQTPGASRTVTFKQYSGGEVIAAMYAYEASAYRLDSLPSVGSRMNWTNTDGGKWWTASSGGTEFAAASSTVNEDMTLYAHWSAFELQAAGTSAAAVALSWQQIPQATGYKIYRIESGSPMLITTINDAAATSFTDSGLTGNTNYQYRFSWLKSGVESAKSEIAQTLTRPVTVTGLSAETISTTQIDLSWTAMAGVNFVVYKNEGASFDSGGGAGTNSYSATGLTPGKSYVFKVTAKNTSGEGAASSTVTVFTLPARVETPTISGITKTGMTVSWENNAIVPAAYTLYRSTDGVTYTSLGTQTSPFTDSGLTEGHAYSYKIAAVNSGGEGEKSVFAKGITKLTAINELEAGAYDNEGTIPGFINVKIGKHEGESSTVEDFNSGAGGKYTRIGYNTGEIALEDAIAEIKIILNSESTPAGWVKISKNLNQGTGGNAIYLIYRKATSVHTSVIDYIGSYKNSGGGLATLNSDYEYVTYYYGDGVADTNKGASGQFIRITVRKKPVSW